MTTTPGRDSGDRPRLEPSRGPLPGRRLRRVALGAAAVATLALASATPSAIAAETFGVELRVATAQEELAGVRQFVEPGESLRVRTDRRAECFGTGTGGSGSRVSVEQATPLGTALLASRTERMLRPVEATDSFSFALGVCGFGGRRATAGGGFWTIRVDHAFLESGGDAARVRRGDAVLWYLTSTQSESSAELGLDAPDQASPGAPVAVRALAYDNRGRRTPAAGATIIGGATPVVTDGAGRVAVPSPSGQDRMTLRVLRGADLAAPPADVCLAADADRCEPPGLTILGSEAGDAIDGTRGPDSIDAGGGDDRIDVRGGGRDVVRCGRGRRDRVKADRTDRVSRSCERIKE